MFSTIPNINFNFRVNIIVVCECFEFGTGLKFCRLERVKPVKLNSLTNNKIIGWKRQNYRLVQIGICTRQNNIE